MCTHSSSNLPVESPPNPTTSNPKRHNRRRSKQPFILEESPVDTMADQRTMAELLRAPTEGYAEAIVVPLILAKQFELKHSLINMMTSDQFFRLEKDNPHDHIRWFNKITSTIKYKDVPNSTIKLMLFPFSLARAARRWLEKEPPRSILTWEDLAWDRYKDLLRACPHHGFTELHQLDTFYNTLNPADQDSLNSVVGGNLLERLTQDVLMIIENKSKVRNSRNKSIVSQVKSSDANSSSSFEIAKLTHSVNQQTSDVTIAMTAILKQFQVTSPPAFVKAVEEICVTCRGHLTSNTIANPKGELKAITTRSGSVLDGPSIFIPPLFINLEEDERVEETLTDQDLDPLHPNIPYPSRMHKQKQQEKDKVQIYKFWQMFKHLHINITLADALILIPKYEKMLKALLSNKEKLLELANTPLNENCSALIGQFANRLELQEMSSFRLASSHFKLILSLLIMRVILESPFILGRPFLRTARALIDVHEEEMILRDGDERLTLNIRHGTSSYFNQPQKESINMINIFNDSSEDFLEDLFETNHLSGNPTFSPHPNLTSPKVKDDVFDPEGDIVLTEKLLDLDSTKDLHPPHNVNPLSGSTTSLSSLNHLLEEFTDELALITFPSGNDDLPFDIESDLKEIKYLLNHDPIKEIDSILEGSVDKDNLADLNDNLADTMPKMFTDEHALDYSSLSLYDKYDDDLFKVESNTEYVYDDPFDSKGKKIKESKLLIDELDLPRSSDFLPSSEYDSFLFDDFSKVDALPSTDNEDKVFNLGILIQENLYEVITRVAPDKNVKKIAISHASLILKDFDPPLYELPFLKEVLGFKTLLSFSSENEEKVFKPGILTSKGVHFSLLPELSHRGYKVFKIIKILKKLEIFLFSHGEDIRILDVPCLHFYPS
uniref:Reverse transcriptase domain-containing protein n=1 Tax=Tanacetum cinerariifolium TaxID=118510 RepID=A0A699HXD0_TANCI|nr:reverse transcriptase domain-containing protein [Tanacetum cinerariifolium]